MNQKPTTSIPRVPQRPADSHKGSVGRIVVFGGSWGEVGMVGAPALTANAALRSGAGLVQIVTEPDAMPMVATLAPCATTRCLESSADLSKLAVEFGADVVAIGPGMGNAVSADQILSLLQSFSGGIVVDADALNTLATVGEWLAAWPGNVVLTPHPGEFNRLLEGFGMPLLGEGDKASERDRAESANAFAAVTRTTVVLKGMGTIVSDPEQYYVNQTGNSGMATAGTGDVLTGMIAALVGQKLSATDAAILGVYAHGLAGDAAAAHQGRISMTALDMIDALAEVFSDLSHDGNR